MLGIVTSCTLTGANPASNVQGMMCKWHESTKAPHGHNQPHPRGGDVNIGNAHLGGCWICLHVGGWHWKSGPPETQGVGGGAKHAYFYWPC